MKIYAGTSGFSYKEWKGTFYPEKIAAKDMLRFYSGKLRAVEVNNTFYHMPTKDVLRSWAEQTSDDFLFALKAPQVITHFKQLRNVFEETEYVFKTLPVLGGKLGPVLFQFPKSFRPDKAALDDFLGILPAGAACAFEFRNAGWIEDGIIDLLRKKGCSLCIADTDENPAGKIIGMADWGYLRLRRSEYTDADLSAWAERVLFQDWKRAFVFFKHEGEGAAGANLALRFQEIADAMAQKTAPKELKKAG